MEDINKGEAKEQISEREREIVKMHFLGGMKLSKDFVNAYSAFFAYFNLGKNTKFEKLEPIQTYEEYFRDSDPRSFSLNMKLSDKDAIISLNKLIKAFNLDLERIKEKKDIIAINSFLDNLANLMSSKNENI